MEQKRFPVFAERFSLLRGRMSQEEFGEFIGVSRPTVGFYENGERLPDALVLCQIAERCEVSADWLLGLTHIQSPDAEAKQVANYTGLSERALSNLVDNDWWYERTNVDGSPVFAANGMRKQFPHDGLMPSEVITKLLEDDEFMQIIGTISRQTTASVRKVAVDYDTSKPPCEESDDGIRVNPIMWPFSDAFENITLSQCERHFGAAVKKLLHEYEEAHPLSVDNTSK